MKSKIILVLSLIILAVTTVACEKEGGAEKAGKKIDETFDAAKDKIDEAAD